jgi:DegV family protein with EDD domain
MMTVEAVRLAAAGQPVPAILARLDQFIAGSRFYFVVDTLEYLQKGGRIGNAKAFLGTLLKIKPILVLQDGLIEPLEQVRSKRKALTRMIDLAEERLNGKGAQATVHVCHAVCPEEAVLLKDEVMARLGCAEPAISEVGAVLGSHTGPGVIGMAVCV